MGKGLTRLPADIPRTPGPRNVDFRQFCDRLRTNLHTFRVTLMAEEASIQGGRVGDLGVTKV